MPSRMRDSEAEHERVICEACSVYVSFPNLKCECMVPDLRQFNVSSRKIHDSYVELYHQIATEDLHSAIQSTDSLEEKARADFQNFAPYLFKLKASLKGKSVRVLEVGPGSGHLARLLQVEGIDYFATDIVPSYLEKLGFPSFLANVELLPAFDSLFDCIILCDVMEHVMNEGDAWLSIYRCLTKNGFIYVRSPFNEPLINYATQLGGNYPFVHLRTYNNSTIRNGARSVGFIKIKVGKNPAKEYSFASRSFGLARLAERNALIHRSAIKSTSENRNLGENSRSIRRQYNLASLIWFARKRSLIFEQIWIRLNFRSPEIYLIAYK